MTQVNDEYRKSNDLKAGAVEGERKKPKGKFVRHRHLGIKLLHDNGDPDFDLYEAVRALDHCPFTGFNSAFNLRIFMCRDSVDPKSPVFDLLAYFARKNPNMKKLLTAATKLKGKSRKYREDNIGLLGLPFVREFEALAKQYADHFIRFLYLRVIDGDKIREFPDFSAAYWGLFKLSMNEYHNVRRAGKYAISMCNIMDKIYESSKKRRKVAEPA